MVDLYLEVVASLTEEDASGELLARQLWGQMSAEQRAEVRRLHREPLKGYTKECRPYWAAN